MAHETDSPDTKEVHHDAGLPTCRECGAATWERDGYVYRCESCGFETEQPGR